MQDLPGPVASNLTSPPMKGPIMKIDKAQIIEFLKSQGEQDKAGQAEADLPDQVDTDRDANLLQKYGIDPKELLGKLGGGGLGGILG